VKSSHREVIVGIGGYLGHDANAAVLVDGELVAASQEERFSRIKHDGAFPYRAIEDCLQIAGLTRDDVVACVFAEKPVQTIFFNRTGETGNALTRLLGRWLPERWGRHISIAARGYYLGSEPGAIPDCAAAWRLEYTGSLHEFVAAQLAAGKTVGWVRGRMELGARALGARSILADPRAPQMQSKLNLAVKFRESFRPFAPAILAEDVGAWFDSTAESDYMNYTANLLPSRRYAVPNSFPDLKAQLDCPRSEVQSVIHVDFSARLQTVRAGVHPDFHRLISAFKAKTGVPILINTSFNVGGQPIVRTAVEAWDCFVNTDLDLLVLNDQVFRNPLTRSREDKISWLNQFSTSA